MGRGCVGRLERSIYNVGFFTVVNGVGNVDEIVPAAAAAAASSKVSISRPIFFYNGVVFFKCINNSRELRRSRGAAREDW